jgi:hypothetical protein
MEKIRIRDRHSGSATRNPDGPALFWTAGSRSALELQFRSLSGSKMESRRAVDAHNGGVETQKWSLGGPVYY